MLFDSRYCVKDASSTSITLVSPTKETIKCFNTHETLGEGGYGKVYLYTSLEGDSFAVKKGDDPDEPLQELTLRRPLKIPGLLPFVSSPEQNIIVMPFMDGTLETIVSDYNYTFSNTECADILLTLAGILEGLERKGWYYYDLKLSNIMFRFVNDSDEFVDGPLLPQIEIFLGDLGSITPDEENEIPCTHTPDEYIDREDETGFIDVYQHTLPYVWLMGIVALQLKQNRKHVARTHWDNNSHRKEGDLYRSIKDNNSYPDFIKECFRPVDERMSFDEYVDYLAEFVDFAGCAGA